MARPKKQDMTMQEEIDQLRKETLEYAYGDEKKEGKFNVLSADEVYEYGQKGNCKELIDPNTFRGVPTLIYERRLEDSEKFRFASLHNDLCATGFPQSRIYAICTSLIIREWIKRGAINPKDIYWIILTQQQEKARRAAADIFVKQRWMSAAQLQAAEAFSRTLDGKYFGRVNVPQEKLRQLYDELMARPDMYKVIIAQVLRNAELDDDDPDKMLFDEKLAKEFGLENVRRKEEEMINERLRKNSNRSVSYAKNIDHDIDDFLWGMAFLDKHGLKTVDDMYKSLSGSDDCFECSDDEIELTPAFAKAIRSLKLDGWI